MELTDATDWEGFPKVSRATLSMLFPKAGYPNDTDVEGADAEEHEMLEAEKLKRERH